MKRGRKPAVNYDKRHEWLKRHRHGESPPAIADKDGFDVRTVRSNINIARQEEEMGEAKTIIYRDALQSHYSDLCTIAERLADAVTTEDRTDALASERLYQSLRQHLPASRIWKLLDTWNVLLENRVKGIKLLEPRIGNEIKNHPTVTDMFSGREDIEEGTTKALLFQATQWTKGMRGLDVKQDVQLETIGTNTIGKYGAYHLGNMTAEELPEMRQIIQELEIKIITHEEYFYLQEAENQLLKVKADLLDDLAVITLRRIVPGFCRYCPF